MLRLRKKTDRPSRKLKEKTDSSTTNEIQHEDGDIEHLNAVKEMQQAPRYSALKCVEETILNKITAHFRQTKCNRRQAAVPTMPAVLRGVVGRIGRSYRKANKLKLAFAFFLTLAVPAQKILDLNQNHDAMRKIKNIEDNRFKRSSNIERNQNFTTTLRCDTNTDRILSKQQQQLPVCIRGARMAFFKFVGATSWTTIAVTINASTIKLISANEEKVLKLNQATAVPVNYWQHHHPTPIQFIYVCRSIDDKFD
uniref:Uncharacterized protein n=1 Tax=Glossina austeni TaxID=7395 RepID=A0A1A9VRH8_GLOAU